MKEVAIIKMGDTKMSEIEFLSNQLISLTHQLHALRKLMKRVKRSYVSGYINTYNDIKKDILLIRRALMGKFNIIIVRDLSEGGEEK